MPTTPIRRVHEISMFRRFECTEDESNKFWEVAIAGSVLTVRWGKVGTVGQSKDKDLGTPEAAEKESAKLVKEKKGKGYVEIADASGATTEPAATPEQSSVGAGAGVATEDPAPVGGAARPRKTAKKGAAPPEPEVRHAHANGSTFRADPARTGQFDGVPLREKPRIAWRSGGLMFNQSHDDGLTVADGRVYFGGYNGAVVADDLSTGAPVWKGSFTEVTRHDVDTAPAVAAGVAYFTADDRHLHAVDSATGVEKWKTKLGKATASSPAVVDDLVFAGTEDKLLHAVSVVTGKRRWKLELPASVDRAPTVFQDLVLVHAGAVVAAERATGVERWRVALGGSSVVVVDVPTGLAVVTVWRTVHGLDAATGAPRWSSELESSAVREPALADGRVFLGEYGGAITALDAATGRHLWRAELPKGHYGSTNHPSPIVVGDVVYVAAADTSKRDKALLAFDAATGRELWRRGAPWLDKKAPVAAGDRLVVVGTGRVAFRAALPDEGFRASAPLVEGGAGVASGAGYSAGRGITAEPKRTWSIDGFAGVPVLSGSRLFVPGDGKVFAVDAATGEIEWSVPLSVGALKEAGDVLVATVVGGVLALRKSDGQAAWSAPVPVSVSRIVVDRGAVFVTTPEDLLVAIDLASGERCWSVDLEGSMHPPVAFEDLVVVYTLEGRVHGLDRATGQRRWQLETDRARSREHDTTHGPALDRKTGIVVLPTDGDHYVAFDARTGVERWRRDFDSSYVGAVAIGDGVAFLAASSLVSCVSLQDGAVIWSEKCPGWPEQLILTDGVLYIVGDTNLFGLDAASGALLWKGPAEKRLVAADGALFAGSRSALRAYVGPTTPVVQEPVAAVAVVRGPANTGAPSPGAMTGADPGRTNRFPSGPRGVPTGIAWRSGALSEHTEWVDPKDESVCEAENNRLKGPGVVDGDTVYVPGHCGSVVAFDLATGQVRWTLHAPTASPVTRAPIRHDSKFETKQGVAVQDGLVYVAAGSTLYAIDAKAGTIAFQASPGGRQVIETGPLVVGGSVMVATEGWGPGAFDAKTGAKQWVTQQAGRYAAGTFVDLVFGEGLLFSTSSDSVVHAWEPHSGRQVWRSEQRISPNHFAIEDGRLFVTGQNGNVAFEATTGRELWRSALGYDSAYPLAVCRGVLVLDTVLGGVVGLDVETGRELWRFRGAEKHGRVSADADTVYRVETPDWPRPGRITALDPRNGTPRWVFEVEGLSSRAPVTPVDGGLLVMLGDEIALLR
jgi:outer membrane protein assembly factor BamB/predicted DNA-binding WGR domain protein